MEKIMVPILKYTWQNSDNPINSNGSMLISAPFHLSTFCLERYNIGPFKGAERNNLRSVGSVGLRKMSSRLTKSFCFRGLDLIYSIEKKKKKKKKIVLKVRYDPFPCHLVTPPPGSKIWFISIHLFDCPSHDARWPGCAMPLHFFSRVRWKMNASDQVLTKGFEEIINSAIDLIRTSDSHRKPSSLF